LKVSCPCARHESVWGREGITPFGLNLGTIRSYVVSFPPLVAVLAEKESPESLE